MSFKVSEKKFWCLGTSKQWHRMGYSEWVPNDSPTVKHNRVLVCVHGLTRNRHDFDFLIKTLCESQAPYDKIYAVDVVGRGESDYLTEKLEYNYATYNADLASFVGAITMNGEEIDWIGTSMGGLIGMFLSASKNCPIRKLVLNDIGPFAPKQALLAIAEYAGKPSPTFPSFESAIELLETRYKAFGITHEQWLEFAKFNVKKAQDKEEWHFNYDDGIGITFSDQSKIQDVNLWPIWDLIKAKVFLVKGKESTLLLKETVEEMKKRGPGLDGFVEFEGIGHAPALMVKSQIEPIQKFLFDN